MKLRPSDQNKVADLNLITSSSFSSFKINTLILKSILCNIKTYLFHGNVRFTFNENSL